MSLESVSILFLLVLGSVQRQRRQRQSKFQVSILFLLVLGSVFCAKLKKRSIIGLSNSCSCVYGVLSSFNYASYWQVGKGLNYIRARSVRCDVTDNTSGHP